MSEELKGRKSPVFAKPQAISVPVVLVVFNRPKYVALMLDVLKQFDFPKLYVVCDGPRPGNAADAELQAEVLELIAKSNLKCKIFIDVSEVNLGSRDRISSGLTWAFSHEDRLVILEDDCIPTLDFLEFCEVMLQRFETDNSVGMVSGVRNELFKPRDGSRAEFTKSPHIWGWATWRDRWQNFDPQLNSWASGSRTRPVLWAKKSPFEIFHWLRRFEASRTDRSVWDAQWVCTLWQQKQYSIQPPENLVSNIGFGGEATHTKHPGLFANWPTRGLAWPLSIKVPARVRPSSQARLAITQRANNFLELANTLSFTRRAAERLTDMLSAFR